MNVTLRKDELQTEIKLIDGEKAKFFKEKKGNEEVYETYTVRLALRKAIAASFNDETLDADKKLERYMLAQKVWTSDDVELSPSDLTEIKKCVGKIYGIEVVGFLCKYLIPKS